MTILGNAESIKHNSANPSVGKWLLTCCHAYFFFLYMYSNNNNDKDEIWFVFIERHVKTYM